MLDDSSLKYWHDAGHVARRTLEAIKGEVEPGKSWHEVIEAAERFIKRNGGNPAFPATIAVNDLAAHYTTDHTVTAPENWKGEMIFKKGDLKKNLFIFLDKFIIHLKKKFTYAQYPEL